MKLNKLTSAILAVGTLSLVGCNGGTSSSTNAVNTVTANKTSSQLFATSSCLVGNVKFNGSGWYVSGTIDITNNCSSDIDLKGQTISFTSQTTDGKAATIGDASVYANNANYSIKFANASGNTTTGTIDATTSWDGKNNNGVITKGQTLTFSSGANTANGAAFDNVTANSTLVVSGSSEPVVVSQGELDVVVDTTDAGCSSGVTCSDVKVAVTNQAGENVQTITIPVTALGGKYTTQIEKTNAGVYNLSASALGNDTITYNPTSTPEVKAQATTSVTIKYTKPAVAIKTGKATISLASVVPNYTGDLQVQILNAKESNAVVNTYTIKQGGSITTEDLPITDATHAYKVKMTTGIADPVKGLYYIESGLPAVKVTNGQTTSLDIPMKASTVTARRNVTLAISGLANGDTASTTFSDATNKYSYVNSTNQANGNTVYKIENNLNLGLSVKASGNSYTTNPIESTMVVKANATVNAGFTAKQNPIVESGLPATIKFAGTSTASGDLYFHLNLPMGSGNVEKIGLSNNYTDLIISNFVSGAVLGNMMREKYPAIHFNRDYIYGTAFAQLLQENINTANYKSDSDYINNEAERATLLMSGQGGPYQLNDYSKRLEGTTGLGLINYVAIQKSLGFTVAEQDSNAQTAKTGPVSLDHKYFGPLAAVYFHFNDINRMMQNNAASYGPQYQYYSQCMANLAKVSTGDDDRNMYDLILNAAYNAGTYSIIIGDYYRICAGMYGTGIEATQVKSIGNYSLSDTQYQQAIGTKEAIGGTFILYPRQIRIYLDQIYHKQTYQSTAFAGNAQINLSIADTKSVFTNVMMDVAYQHDDQYTYVAAADAAKAFDQAMSQAGVNANTIFNLATSADKEKFFDLLDSAVKNLATNLKFSFAAVTETTIGQAATPVAQCPTNAQTYPSGRGSYVGGTTVKASDGNYYQCNAATVAWCNSTVEWAYAPATGSDPSAWTKINCNS